MKSIKEIPNKINIIDSEFKVKFVDDFLSDTGNFGTASMYKEQIILSNPTESITENTIVETFYHEVLHVILHKLGYDELTTNEQFVDQVATCLNQAFKEMTFRKKNKK